ncbi:MAG: VOC family protein [Steroidobacteraceae bacterium]
MAKPTVRGRFVWHELLTMEVPSAVAYYQKVVGWKTQPWQQDSTYLMWVAKRGPVGGVAGSAAGAAPHWLPYVGTTDIEATVNGAQKLGSKVVVPVTDIPNAGRYAVLADPQGARFGVYGSANATAAAGKPQPGEFAWHELATTDYKIAFTFYQTLFGWEKTGEHDMGEMGMYFMFGVNGNALGGMFNKPSTMPAAWCCYAEVADARKVAKVAAKAGGTVLNGPMQVPGGSWIAQISDPQGAMHAVVSAAPAVARPAKPAAKAAASATVTVKKAGKKKASKKKKAVAKARPARKSAKKKPPQKKVAKNSAKKTVRKPLPKKKAGKKKVALKKLKRSSKTKIAKKKQPAAKRRLAAKRKK